MILLLPILLPLILGAALLSGAIKGRAAILRYVAASVILTAVSAWVCILTAPEGSFTLLRFTGRLTLSLRIDGLSKLFGAMVATLWVPTTFYAFEYMKHEGGERKFYGFFIMSFGVVMGVAFAANLFTLYLFYEYLSFSTLPLVMHAMDDKARFAGKRYLIYMVLGGALAFVALLFLLNYAPTLDFVMGGTLDPQLILGRENQLRWVFLVAFLGFGVKAAVFPLHRWLPTASVAPTPVTALLHAVAVVKAGVFAIIRITFYSFGTALLMGSFAQNAMLVMAIVTILFGSAMALRTPHLKRRLAYSTVSNLSYILFGAALMSTGGLSGALMHMVLHASIKIVLFFCAGTILHQTKVEYVKDMGGMGQRMPVTMACFTVCSLLLIGVPPLGAFNSKWYMATAAAVSGNPLAVLGVAALMASEVMTALYLFGGVIRAYFKPADVSIARGQDEAGKLMTLPIALITVCAVALSLGANQLFALIQGLI